MIGGNIMVNLGKYDEIAEYLIENGLSGLVITENEMENGLDVSRYDTVIERIL